MFSQSFESMISMVNTSFGNFLDGKDKKETIYSKSFFQIPPFSNIADMFTGIIEYQGLITNIEESAGNRVIWIQSPISHELKIDQSIAHDGVCLTVDQLSADSHRVTAIAETLDKTTIRSWTTGNQVNLERCMQMNGRLDGHIVQGHVDCTATCTEKTDQDGSWKYRFQIPSAFAKLIIEKGSIAVNGTSLTIFDVSNDAFSVAIIPYTYTYTTIGQVEPGMEVNIEFDMIGKYVNRIHAVSNA
jgi:riboflavin synthase